MMKTAFLSADLPAGSTSAAEPQIALANAVKTEHAGHGPAAFAGVRLRLAVELRD
jgi:hypothetical protein